MEAKEEIKKITNEFRNIPLWLQYTVAFATIFGTLFGGWGIYIVSTRPGPEKIVEESKIEKPVDAIDLVELLIKALTYETVLERQDFLTKYVGSKIYGKGQAKQISRYGSNSFLVDILVNKVMVSCRQDANAETEKELLLLQDKVINFTGNFTYTSIFEHGLEIGECKLQKDT
ncbi:MAG: hypothetical protein HYS74_02160 [Parcubacteria group bacterium]|nr:hypothetical protein [Parcubacteria group bacterium]